MSQTFTQQGCSSSQLAALAASLIPNELSAKQKAARDWDLAQKLDRKGNEYQAKGDHRLAAICRSHALGAANRAVEFDRLSQCN